MGWKSPWIDNPQEKRLEKQDVSIKEVKQPDDRQNVTEASVPEQVALTDERVKFAVVTTIANAGLLDASKKIERIEEKIESINISVGKNPTHADLQALREKDDGKFLSSRALIPVVSVFVVLVIPLVAYTYITTINNLREQIVELKSQVNVQQEAIRHIPNEPTIRVLAREEAERANSAVQGTLRNNAAQRP